MATPEDDIPPPPPKLEQPRDQRHQFLSPRNQHERDAWAAARWTINGWSCEQIGNALEISKSSAFYSIQRGLRHTREMTEATAEQARAAHRARLEAATEVAVEIMYRDHVHVAQGRVVLDGEGKAVLDDGPKLTAVDRVRTLSESLRKLDGLDAPTRHELTMGEIDDALAEAAAELAVARAEAGEAGAAEADQG